MKRAGKHVTREPLRLVIFTPDRNAASETFIRAHIEQLPFDSTAVYGRAWDFVGDDGMPLWRWGRNMNAVARRISPVLQKRLFDSLLARHLTKLRAQAVLAEYGTMGAMVMDGCRKADIPLFAHFHGYDASNLDVLTEYKSAYESLFRRAAGLVTVSAAMRAKLLQLGAPEAVLHLNPYGVDPDRFNGADPGASAPVFIAVGRFVEKKAPYLTVLAFRDMLADCEEARLLMVGAGPLLGPVKRLAAALGISGSVEFLGSRTPEAISSLMRGARAFVQHSLVAEDGDSEGTPVAVIEAQMMGLPVVSTLHAGIPDVVLDGVTGYLVDEGDAQAMGRRMAQLATNASLAAALGKAARQRALDHFTIDRRIAALAAVIRTGVRAKKEGDANARDRLPDDRNPLRSSGARTES